MPSYNLTKPEDLARKIADCKAELAACLNGSWPRDLNDDLRWQALPLMPYDPPEAVQAARRAYVARCLQQEISYCESRLATLGDFPKDPWAAVKAHLARKGT